MPFKTILCPGVQAWDPGTKRTSKRVLLAESLSLMQNLELNEVANKPLEIQQLVLELPLCLGVCL